MNRPMSNFPKDPPAQRASNSWLALLMSAVALTSVLSVTALAWPGPPAGFERKQIVVGGVERSYLFHAPRNASSLEGRRSLVILLHGGGGTANYMATEAGKSFVAAADTDGFYLAIPDAIGRMWGFGDDDVARASARRTDDRAFFEALLNTVTAEQPIDGRRIFAAGISRGGQAAYFMACKFPGRIRAIAAIAMPLPLFLEPACAEGSPVGVALIHGTGDPLVPYDGGDIVVIGQHRAQVLSVDQTVNFWRKRNKCGDTAVATEHIERAGDGMHVERSSWERCGGAPVLLYRIVGGGHTWPSGKQYLPVRMVGKVNRDIDGATEIWSFFRTFR